MKLNGVGETTATCLLAMIGNGHEFSNARQFAAWLGLVPGQYSSGGKTFRAASRLPANEWVARVRFSSGSAAITPPHE